MHILRMSWLLLTGLMMSSACVEAPALSATTDRSETFEEFRARTPREPAPAEGYLVEGDVSIGSDEELYQYWLGLDTAGALSVYRLNSQDQVWNSTNKRNLTYCVNNNLGSNKAAVVLALEAASREWEMSADVDFRYLPGQDANCTSSNSGVMFEVTQVAQDYFAGSFGACTTDAQCESGLSCRNQACVSPISASAPYPNGARSSRQLRIRPALLDNSPSSKKNILGHEFGHLLGFVHEHIRPESNASGLPDCSESTGYRPLTEYDPASIMHYRRCNGAENRWWSTRDRTGVEALYGGTYRSTSDILWQNTDASVAVWKVYKNGTVGQGAAIPASSSGWDVKGNGDFDGDGRDDVLLQATSGQMQIWFMNGDIRMSVGALAAPAAGWRIVGVGDLDGDLRADILWRSVDNRTLAAWLMNGTDVRFAPAFSVPADFSLRGIADMNRDGVSDLVLSVPDFPAGRTTYRVWRMANGTLMSEYFVASSIEDAWQIAGLSDFNNDGYGDILWRYVGGTGAVAIWHLKEGTRLGDLYPRGPVGSDWSIQGVGDFAGDSRKDILWRNQAGQLAVWFDLEYSTASEWYPGLVNNPWRMRGTGRFN